MLEPPAQQTREFTVSGANAASEARTVTATFVDFPTLTVNKTGEGTGTVSLRGLGWSGDENLHLTERFRRLDNDTLTVGQVLDAPRN